MKKRYFKEYWEKDDLFCNPPETYCILYMKKHKWSPFWKRVGTYTDGARVLEDLLSWTKYFDVYILHPVLGYVKIHDFLKEGKDEPDLLDK